MNAIHPADARGPVVVIVDAYSTARHLTPLFRARGHTCVHVQSTPTVPAVYAPSFRPGDFAAHVVHTGDLAATLAAVARHEPVALLAGIESGVELADTLAESLGLRGNGTALSPARRDKFRMTETVKAAGLPGAEQILAGDRDTLLDWYGRQTGRVVLKPVSSAGNDGVHFCDSAEDVLRAFGTLIGTDSALGQHNSTVLAQEYLSGSEYYVNTVSLDGRHHVCDIWKTQHLDVNGVRDLLGGSQLMVRHGPEQDRLVPYTLGVLDALGIRNGPAHTELKLTPDGPRLIETGARVCGADLPLLTSAAIGAGHLERTVEAHVRPEEFAGLCGTDYEVARHATVVNMIAPDSGTLRGYPKMARLKALESFRCTLERATPGGPVHRTVNDFTYPMLVHLLHEVEGVVLRDYMTARYLDGEGFYDIV
ncbi:ATP-grasp domain-containing protein [Streptomyces sp. NPDC006393]|uniref:ATP-grasp domain-containing protein n=1 Tax=Streptomyces sp. NPDC006393 TaxID=3156763 RepID=UPI0033F5A7D7